MPAFQPADPARRLPPLGPDAIHVWRFPMPAGGGRQGIRRLLAAYLDVPPDTLRFDEGPHGRPTLGSPHDQLDVNWTHSDGMGVLAMAHALPVLGIDFEALRPRPRALALARRFFHPDEYLQLADLPHDRVESDFLRLWTAKEAVLKALGEGLQFGLDRIRFRFEDAHLSIDAFDAGTGVVDDWHMRHCDDASGYTCLAWRGTPRRVDWFETSVP